MSFKTSDVRWIDGFCEYLDPPYHVHNIQLHTRGSKVSKSRWDRVTLYVTGLNDTQKGGGEDTV